MKIPICLLAVAGGLCAGQTRTWTQGEAGEFEKGNMKNLSLRSDGRLSLSPATKEVFDTGSSYLWAMAKDSKGNLYTGGGTGAKLYRIAPDGKGALLADLDALEIHAIAVDSRDRVYAATSPDGKVYRIAGNGKPEVFYDPQAKYIWALALDPAGNLYVATGDRGELHRVTPDGKGAVFFKSEETHVRSLALDAKGNLIAGTEPGGLVVRISPAGEGFVLFQMPKREVTAVAQAPDGAIYAAAVGNRQATPAPAPQAPPPTAPAAAVPGQVTVNLGTARPPAGMVPPASSAPGGVAGGSEVYRIDGDGAPQRMWGHAQEVVYAIAFDAAGKAVLGTGNKGNVYRIESPALYTTLLALPATQVTAFQLGSGGKLYAATGNTGKVYEVGPAQEREGWIESDVFDAGMYALWGRVGFEGNLHGGQVTLATRSGNLDRPQKNWSAWAPVPGKAGRSASPAARFVQWKATLAGGAELDSVDVAYLPKNVEPRVDEIEATPANYRFPPSSAGLITFQQTLNLPPLGRRTGGGAISMSSDSPPAMQYAKGYMGARWSAADPNGDSMVYTVEIKGTSETEWKLLKEKLAEKYISWDSTAFADGEYRVRVTASDGPSNPPADALTGRLEGSPFWIDNTPPKITGLGATRQGGRLQVKWHAVDALNQLVKAEYAVDGGEWKVVAPVSRLSDALELDYEVMVEAAAGEHTVAVRVEDDYGNVGVEKVVVR
ncbi:MAG: hypothetical protein ABI759_07295 [Candidatus Solibacter sp.]